MKKFHIFSNSFTGTLEIRRKILCAMLIGTGLTLTGCGNSFDHMPDLTEEESAMIAEYAAGILLKHDKNRKALASDYEIEKYDEREAILHANTQELMATQESSEVENGQEELAETEGAQEAPAPQLAEAAFGGVAQFCGLDGFQIDYKGHVICDSYPPADSEDMVFAMDATQGNKLLVLEFTGRNTTMEDKELNVLEQNVQFRIAVNDSGARNILPTLLLNDLSSYRDVVPAGSEVTLVLVREVTEEEANGISTISLSLRNESGDASTVLE